MVKTGLSFASKFARRLLRTVRPSARQDVEGLARWLVARLVSRRSTRTWLNAAYNRLSLAQQASVYVLFAKLFRAQSSGNFVGGEWWINIGGRRVVLPLSADGIWLEWDQAVSMLGHEPEIKCTYLELLRRQPPKLFLDVGANYGLHSLFFLVHDVPTVSFEPNPRCHEYFRGLAARNNVFCDLRAVALGATEGRADIAFPERETWLGSSNPKVQDELSRRRGELTWIPVARTTLDAFVRRDGRRPDLIKIDTEGNEAEVVRGARETLKTCRPRVIFESWREPGSRAELLTFFEEVQYRICPLPLRLPYPDVVFDRAGFLDSAATNFIAVPIESAGK